MVLTKRRPENVGFRFGRLFLLVYLLSKGHPSSAVTIPITECLDSDILPLLAGNWNNAKAWIKLGQCMAMFSKENPKVTEEFKVVYDSAKRLIAETLATIDAGKVAGGAVVMAAFVTSLYLASHAFDLYWIKLPEHLENVAEYGRELDILYKDKIKPVLEDIQKLYKLRNWQNYTDEIIAITKELFDTLGQIGSTLSRVLEKIKSEKLKVIKNQGTADIVGVSSGLLAGVTTTAAIWFPPAGAAMLLGYGATIGVSSLTAAGCYKVRSDLSEQLKRLEKLQSEAYDFKDKLAFCERQLTNILMASKYKSWRILSFSSFKDTSRSS